MDKKVIHNWGCRLLQLFSALFPAVRYKPRQKRGLSTAIRQPLSSIALLGIGLLAVGLASAQTQNIGPVVSYKKTAQGIEGKTATAIFRLSVYNAHTIRVQVSRLPQFNPLPYALLPEQAASRFTNFTLAAEGNTIVLRTSAITAEIEQSPAFRVIFKNPQGLVINQDVAAAGFGTTFIGHKASVYKTLQPGERFLGLGQALGNLDKRGSGYTLNNTDTYQYGDPRLSMYISVPFYIGIHQQQQYGLFFNNGYKTFFNFGLSTPQFASVNMDGGDVDYFFIYGATVPKILEHYTALTGRMPMPPQWALGYHQSRCSYYPQQKVEWIAETFRRKQIPIDCIVLDADYQLGYQPFRIDSTRFPNLKALSQKLADQHIQLTASVYPGIKIDSSYTTYRSGLAQDVFLKYSSGQMFETEIAPVKCVLPDFTHPKTRTWWKQNMRWMKENGIRGYWNDMNEPAIGGSYLPDNLVFDFDGKKADALAAKNVYGFQMARSSYEAALENHPNLRPFVLSRSGFAGVQRYAAVWSGDNTTSNQGLLSSVLLNSQMGLSGIPFCGHDIGGFIGNASTELYIRWLQVGVFSPFCRNHRGCGFAAGEPWAYGDAAEAISKNYIGFRYRLMPYLYQAFYEASTTGLPIAQSLAIPYPHQPLVYDPAYQYQFMFGPSLLIVPVTSEEVNKKIYLPPGKWYNLYTDTKLEGNAEKTVELVQHQLPVFVKASAIIPIQSLVQSTGQQPGDTLYLHIYNGDSSNTYTYYEDDGSSLAYQKGQYLTRQIQFDPARRQLTIGAQQGDYTSHFKLIQCVFHGFSNAVNFLWNQQSIASTTTASSILPSLDGLDQVYDPQYFAGQLNLSACAPQHVISFSFQNKPIQIRW